MLNLIVTKKKNQDNNMEKIAWQWYGKDAWYRDGSGSSMKILIIQIDNLRKSDHFCFLYVQFTEEMMISND